MMRLIVILGAFRPVLGVSHCSLTLLEFNRIIEVFSLNLMNVGIQRAQIFMDRM